MGQIHLAQPMLTLSVMLLLAVIIMMALQRCHFPYTVGLVIAGLITGLTTDYFEPLGSQSANAIRSQVTLSHDLILYVLLPPLVYEASLAMDARLLRRNLAPILLLAVAGLLISTFIVGYLVSWLTPLTLLPALVFGALISATDPVAVIALFREVDAPERLSLLMDGESLFNDATAIVLFQVMLGLVVAPVINDSTIISAIWDFLRIFLGGAIVGAIIGLLISMLASLQTDDRMVQITLSNVAAWGSFILADHYLELSGVMACVAAGLVTGYYARTRLGNKVLMAAQRWWSYATFLANSYVFLLLGLQEELLLKPKVILSLHWLLIAILVVLLARLAVIYLILPGYNFFAQMEQRIDQSDKFIMFWGGLRGAVPMALILALGPDFPQRTMVFNMTLAVILWTLLVQGTTMKPLLKRLLSNNKTN
ncbi:cation:proton antiporter [Parendozoicomonas sp. Alg238-R29]|uniref:cation:proton antiporter n=1 Tax=Parendozoicomonas sp. Alg238-R29 TaxID=2993446 RepID=UPI00248D9BB5|nr:cation:proton antiporter [Parendozoicomonas sp. Alg238-R29]